MIKKPVKYKKKLFKEYVNFRVVEKWAGKILVRRRSHEVGVELAQWTR
jgi:hypothetical protein